MKEHLLAITTAGKFSYTVDAVNSVRDNEVDVLVIDDATPRIREILSLCKREIKLITKEQPKGLTNSWNIAYQNFKQGGYKTCTISNHDVIFAPNSLGHLREATQEYILVGPLTNQPGTGWKHQQITKYVRTNLKNPAFVEKNIRNLSAIESGYVNGFCFCFNRRIIQFELREGILFNPAHINVGVEGPFCAKLKKSGQKIGVARKSYVFHYKSVICPLTGNREKLWR